MSESTQDVVYIICLSILFLDQSIRLTSKPRGEAPADVASQGSQFRADSRDVPEDFNDPIDFVFPFHHEVPEGGSFVYMPR